MLGPFTPMEGAIILMAIANFAVVLLYLFIAFILYLVLNVAHFLFPRRFERATYIEALRSVL